MSPASQGRVLDESADAVRIDGLVGAGFHDLVAFEGGGLGLVTALRTSHVEAARLDCLPVTKGQRVTLTGPLVVPAGEDLVGRVVDGLARPLDGGPPLSLVSLHRLFFPAPVVLPPTEPKRLTLGLLVHDLKRSFQAGSAILTLGHSPWLPLLLLRHQTQAGRICIYARPGTSGASGRTFRELAEAHAQLISRHAAQGRLAKVEPLPPCIIVEAGRAPSPAGQWLVPWTAMAIGASLRERGRDAVVILDSLDAWKPYVSRFPHMGGWLTQAGQLTTQAYASSKGSLSLLAATSHGLARSLESLFDATVDLERAVDGYPFQDRTKLVRPPVKMGDRRTLGRAMVLLAPLEALEHLAPRLVLGEAKPEDLPPWQAEMRQALRLRACLQAHPGMSVDSAEQLLTFVAVCGLDDLPASGVPAFVESFQDRLRRDYSGLLSALRQGRLYSEEDQAVLQRVAQEIGRAVQKQVPWTEVSEN